MTPIPPPIAARLEALPEGLREHIQRTRQVARELAERHGVDAAKADLGAAAHDLARALKGDALLEQARRHRYRVQPVERHTPVLLHGPVAALWLKHEDGVSDPEVLEAVRWHSTGRRGMGPVAKVVFLADKLDPQKVQRYPYLERIHSLAQRSLDQAMLEFLGHELEYLLQQGRLIHPASVELRNELMIGLGRIPPSLRLRSGHA